VGYSDFDRQRPGVLEIRCAGRFGPGRDASPFRIAGDQTGCDGCVADESVPGGDPGRAGMVRSGKRRVDRLLV
jgi:hypothetical protein